MPQREFYLERIEKEFAAARAAQAAGNEGKARVCARRAAGEALSWYRTVFPQDGWRNDALGMIAALKDDSSLDRKSVV